MVVAGEVEIDLSCGRNKKNLLRLACLGRFWIVAAAVAEAPKMKHSSTGNFGGQEEERR